MKLNIKWMATLALPTRFNLSLASTKLQSVDRERSGFTVFHIITYSYF